MRRFLTQSPSELLPSNELAPAMRCWQSTDEKEDGLHTWEAGGLRRPSRGTVQSTASSPCGGQTHTPRHLGSRWWSREWPPIYRTEPELQKSTLPTMNGGWGSEPSVHAPCPRLHPQPRIRGRQGRVLKDEVSSPQAVLDSLPLLLFLPQAHTFRDALFFCVTWKITRGWLGRGVRRGAGSSKHLG